MKQEQLEMLGEVADTIDNIIGALALPLPATMHVGQLKQRLPELRNTIRSIYVAEAGEDPWSTHPKEAACKT